MKLLVPYTITDASLISSTAPENEYPVWVGTTAYALGVRAMRLNTHRIYERLVPGTTATAPELDSTNWMDIGPTNRWAMFDGAIGTRTSRTSPLTVSLSLGAVNDIVLLGVTGTTVTVTRPNGTTVSASVPAAVVASEGSTVAITGIAGTAGTYQVAVTGTGTVAVGTLCLGTLTSIGGTRRGYGVGIEDSSTQQFDAYGTPKLVKRPYRRRNQAQLVFTGSSLDQVVRIVAAVRSMPVIWIGNDSLTSTVNFGIYSKFRLTWKSFARVECSIQLLSLAQG